jgi:hypothetical protein
MSIVSPDNGIICHGVKGGESGVKEEGFNNKAAQVKEVRALSTLSRGADTLPGQGVDEMFLTKSQGNS